jgi:hypothetical protein
MRLLLDLVHVLEFFIVGSLLLEREPVDLRGEEAYLVALLLHLPLMLDLQVAPIELDSVPVLP